MKTIANINNLPYEIVRVPFLFHIVDKDSPEKVLKMEFWAGFMGLKQDDQTFNLKPEIGWAINLVSDNKVDSE